MMNSKEKLMYEVMKAIYEQSMPICFKGSMVLKACLLEAGYVEEVRHTVDIDANWNSDTPPSADTMVSALQTAIEQAGINAKVRIYRMYGEGRSAGFTFTDQETDEELFLMDMDVNRPIPDTQIYEIEGLRFRGVSPTQMIADKVSAISTEKVFRRIKDVVDLYYLSKVFSFDKADVLRTLKANGRELDHFQGFLQQPEELRHAYEKFRLGGDVYKPPFDEVYAAVKAFLKDVLPKEKSREQDR
ncbi:MAG: nucleotidyl transferase AbiEii/AbiGii toxin family protein [Clostridia bacterium]|nr:nucleotidyl transferase AbiEii/AbiGii toxin family protein [Clostridia bacterium]